MSKDSSKSAEGQALVSGRLAKSPAEPGVAIVYAIVVYLVAQIVASLVVILYPHLRGWSPQHAQQWLAHTVLGQFWYVLLAEALTVLGVWWFVRKYQGGLRSIGWRSIRWRDAGFALLGLAAYFVVYIILYSIAVHIFQGDLNAGEKQDLGFSNTSGAFNLALTFISLVILPPLAEETLFRGFLFTSFRRHMKLPVAVLLTSVLFALPHLFESGNGSLLWVVGIDTFTLSVVLCILREKTNSLWPGILLHGLKNTIAFLSLFIFHAS